MKIQKNISLKNKNWFQTGGNAKFYCEPENETLFQEALNFSKENNLETFVLGSGANILISDAGFDGLVIKPTLNKIEINQDLVIAQAGVTIEELINNCLDNNLVGLEEFSGIPGTVGGSVFINIHYFNYFLSDFLVSAKVIEKETGQIKTVNKNWFEFGYDKSKLFEKKLFLIDAIFQLKKVDNIQTAHAKGKSDERILQRNNRYPNSNTCGSFFRNFHADEIVKTNNKLPFIAYYLDKLGIKGELFVGKAKVSHQHANMIVTEEGATSSDVIKLAQKMQQLVFDNFGILPQPECQFIGFDEYQSLTKFSINNKLRILPPPARPACPSKPWRRLERSRRITSGKLMK
ncbi:MAG: UDP-N-acetylmuramate dehydrogenase [bacterium]